MRYGGERVSGLARQRRVMAALRQRRCQQRQALKERQSGPCLSALVEVRELVTGAAADVEQVVEVILDRLRQLTPATGAAVGLRDGDELYFPFASGDQTGNRGTRLRIASSLSGQALTSGEIVHTSDTEADDMVDRVATRQVRVRSMIVVPLRDGAGVIGVLNIVSSIPYAFSEQDLQAVRMLAGFIGTALRHALDYERLQDQTSQLQAANEELTIQAEELQAQGEELQALYDRLWRQKRLVEEEVLERTRDLSHQRNFLADMLDSLPGGVLVIDCEFRIRMTNARYAEAFGRVPEDLVGQYLFETFPGTEEQHGALLRGEMDAGKVATFYSFPWIFQHEGQTVETFWDFTGRPLYDMNGRPDGYLVLCFEVTPRVLLERQLAEKAQEVTRQNAFLRTIVENVPAGVSYVGADHRYRWLNDRASEIIGLTKEALLGRTIREVMPHLPDDDSFLEGALRGERQELSAVPVPLIRDGKEEVVYLDVTAAPIMGPDGGIEGVLQGAVDVTGRVERERAQAGQVAALREASILKDEFLAIVSHELRTPLAVILNAAAILTKGRAGALTPDQARFSAMILDQVAHLRRLVDDLLDLQKLQTGGVDIELKEDDLLPLLQVEMANHGLVFQERGQTFECTLPQEPLWAAFDADRIRQVLQNLLGNAAKFTPEGGLVSLRAGRRGAMVFFEVCDSGIGIASEDHDRIFDKFVQLETGAERRTGGAGLGLAIARSIIEGGHGGSLQLRSRPGEGSCFTVELPGCDLANR